MKYIQAFIFLIVSFFSVNAQQTYTITVNFVGLESNKGDVFVALYNNKKDFLKTEFKGTIVKVEDLKATASFKVEKGEYAISTFHDVNDNKKMDTNFIGIPKEPIGISNNAKGFLGPPKFKKAKFMVDDDVSITIKIAKF